MAWHRRIRTTPAHFNRCCYQWKCYKFQNIQNVEDCLTLKMKATRSSETSGFTYPTQCNIHKHLKQHHRQSLMSRKTGFCYVMLCLYLVNQPYHFLHITIFFYINKMYIYFYKKITPLTLTENIIKPVTEYTQ